MQQISEIIGIIIVTLRPQHAAVFERVISVLPSNGEVVQYLEVGSANGASMSLVAMLLKRAHPNCRLVSIDPYYENGYEEGARGPIKTEISDQYQQRYAQSSIAFVFRVAN